MNTLHKKIVSFFSFALVLLLFTACSVSPDSTAPNKDSENFLNNTNDQTLMEICQGFYLMRYGISMFNEGAIEKSSDISQTGMYIYLVDTDKNVEQFYDKSEQMYKIPVDYAQNYINKYFDNYTLKPSEISYPDVYDPDTKALIPQAFPSPDTGFPEISAKEAIDADTVKISVEYFDRYEDQNSKTVLYTENITLKIVGNDYKFVSSTITK